MSWRRITYAILGRLYPACIAFAVASLALTLWGCGIGKDEGAEQDGNATCPKTTGAAAQVFATSLLPVLQGSCQSCHNASSPQAQSPFADPNATVAYGAARPFADFNNPSASYFKVRMDNRHNCGTSEQCDALAARMVAQIGVWAAAEAQSVSSGCSSAGAAEGRFSVRTATLRIPTGLSTTTPTTLIFDLKSATPAVTDAIVAVDVQGVSSDAFVIKNPSLAIAPRPKNKRANIRISALQLFINGTENPGARNFTDLDFVVEPVAFPTRAEDSPKYTIVSPVVQMVGIENASGDTLELRFVLEETTDLPDQEVTDPFACKNKANFDPILTMILTSRVEQESGQSRACVDCHGVMGSAAYNKFPMTGAGVDSCRQFKIRSTPNSPLSSYFYVYPTTNGTTHTGGRYIFSNAERTAISTWLNGER